MGPAVIHYIIGLLDSGRFTNAQVAQKVWQVHGESGPSSFSLFCADFSDESIANEMKAVKARLGSFITR